MRKIFIMCAALSAMNLTVLSEETPDIIEFNQGICSWTNINPSLHYSLEWRSALSPSNSWHRSFRNLQDIQSPDALISVEVPMFFRVVGSPMPISTESLNTISTEVTEGYYEQADLTQVDTDLSPENIKAGVTVFGVTGTLEGSGNIDAKYGPTLQLPSSPFHGQEYYDTDLQLWVKFNEFNSKWETLTGVAIYEG